MIKVSDPIEAAKRGTFLPRTDDSGHSPAERPRENAAVHVTAETSRRRHENSVTDGGSVTPIVRVLPPLPVVSQTGRYRVLATRSISWCGSMTRLTAGSIVSEDGYGGPAGIARLRAQGVELEATG